MVLIIKQKCKYYRKYEKDIWGVSYNNENAMYENYLKVWALRFFYKIYKKKRKKLWKRLYRFVYRLDLKETFRRKKKYNLRWLSIRITRLYFLTIQDHQFREIFKKASKLDGNLDENYCHLLEGRLLTIFYRTNFLPDIFRVMEFIKNKGVLIDYKIKNYMDTIVKIGSFITFRKKYSKKIKTLLKRRTLIYAIMFNKPKFMFISYLFSFAYMLRKPREKDLVYPIAIDIQRIRGYY